MADEHFVYGTDFQSWLSKYDLNYETAATIFNVTSKTIREWIKAGPEGTAAHFIGYLVKAGIPPRHVIDMLGLTVTNIRRSQTKVKHGARRDGIRDKLLKYLFKCGDEFEVRDFQQHTRGEFGATEIRQALHGLVSLEYVEIIGKSFALTPNHRNKIQTELDAKALQPVRLPPYPG